MLFSSLIFVFFLCISGQEVVIRNSSQVIVNVNEQHFLLCETNIPDPTYEWLYFIEKDKYLPLIIMHSDPRYHFTYPGAGQAKVVCRVRYGDRDYESPPVEINVVDSGFVPPQPSFPDETVTQVDPYYTEPEPPFIVTPSTFEISTFEIPTVLPDPFVTPFGEDYTVTILNESLVTVPMNKESYLLCKASFPAREFEWFRGDESSRFRSVQAEDDPKHIINVLQTGIHNYICQVTLWGNTYRSQIVTVEVVDNDLIYPQPPVTEFTDTYSYYTETEPPFLVTPTIFEIPSTFEIPNIIPDPVGTSYAEDYTVTILNDSRVIVPMNKVSYLLCKATFPVQEYEWLQNDDITGVQSIQIEADPRHIVNVLQPGVQHYMCQVSLWGTTYRSQIVMVEVVTHVPSTAITPATDVSKPSTAEALEIWQRAGVNVTILNGSRVHIPTDANYNLVCKTSFPTEQYEWLIYTDNHGYHSIVNQSNSNYKLFFFYPGMHQYECRAMYGEIQYRSQMITVEVSGQIQTQSNIFLIAALIAMLASYIW